MNIFIHDHACRICGAFWNCWDTPCKLPGMLTCQECKDWETYATN